MAHLQASHDPGHIIDQVFRQIPHLGTGIGDDLLALAVVEFLRDFQRLGRRPAEARGAQFLQRGQIVKLGRTLALLFNTHGERALKVSCGLDDELSGFAVEDPILRRVAHLELAARNLGGGDDLKIGHGNEITNFQLAFAYNGERRCLHTANPDDTLGTFAQDHRGCSGEG